MPTLQQGCKDIIFAKFSEKLHEIEKILVHRVPRAGSAPLRSATVMFDSLTNCTNYVYIRLVSQAFTRWLVGVK